MNRQLFKDAIADAKAVKESAILNAKDALQESFSPHLKEVLAQKIREMEEEDLEESFTESVDEEDASCTESEEFDLDEILNEVDDDDDKDDKDDKDSKPTKDSKDSKDDEEETLDLENMTETELEKFVEDVITDMVTAGELEAGAGSEEGIEGIEGEEDFDETGEYGMVGVGDDEEFDLAEIEDDEVEESTNRRSFQENRSRRRKRSIRESKFRKRPTKRTFSRSKPTNTRKSNELREAVQVIKKLKGEINEVNLLNAKLLYTNKLFKANKSLTESQKVAIVEALDKATTPKESKLIYETFLTKMKTKSKKKSFIKENLGFASKPSTGLVTKKQSQIVDPQIARWQKLAGIN